MSSKYWLRPAAVEDMEAIVDYLGERNPVAAVRFVEAAQGTFEHIAFMPRAYPTFRTERAELREVRWRALTGAFNRYLVFYKVDDDDLVDVIRLLHSARDLDRILGGDSGRGKS